MISTDLHLILTHTKIDTLEANTRLHRMESLEVLAKSSHIIIPLSISDNNFWLLLYFSVRSIGLAFNLQKQPNYRAMWCAMPELVTRH